MNLLLEPSKCLMVRLTRSISSTRNKIGVQVGKKPLEATLDTSRIIEKEKEIDRVVLSRDGQVVACWHPPTPFPYEMSKPLPASIIPTDTALKVQALKPVREIFRKKHQKLMVQELMHITNTSKHRWFGKPTRQERARMENPKHEKHDRDYL